MAEPAWLADQFEHWRPHLASVALRFDEIGQIIGRTELAARQLASRARRRVRTAPRPDRDRDVQRRAVSAFLAAARHGDFEALLRVLAPGVVLRFDLGPGREPLPTLSGAGAVARHVLQTAPRFVAFARPAIVNGTVGLLFSPGDEPLAVLSFTVSGGRIAELHLVADPAKLMCRAGHGRYEFPATSPSVRFRSHTSHATHVPQPRPRPSAAPPQMPLR